MNNDILCILYSLVIYILYILYCIVIYPASARVFKFRQSAVMLSSGSFLASIVHRRRADVMCAPTRAFVCCVCVCQSVVLAASTTERHELANTFALSLSLSLSYFFSLSLSHSVGQLGKLELDSEPSQRTEVAAKCSMQIDLYLVAACCAASYKYPRRQVLLLLPFERRWRKSRHRHFATRRPNEKRGKKSGKKKKIKEKAAKKCSLTALGSTSTRLSATAAIRPFCDYNICSALWP